MKNLLSLFKPSERLAVNADKAVTQERDQLFRANINLRAALIDIRNQGIASKSGTAQAMARKAKKALS